LLKTVLVPINPEGGKFIAIFAAFTLALFLLWEPLGWIGVAMTLWCAYFFRDPERHTPTRKNLVIAPADGVVQYVDQAPLPKELEMGEAMRNRVCIFMNVFNVHVNRVPIDGTISKLAYVPGKFVNASLDKASEFNERQCVALKMEDEREIAFVQIAGLVARRIKCDIREDQPVKAGERFGLIRFGSRVDIYLPEGVSPLVAVGQLTTAGETVIADLDNQEDPRQAEVR
jgi:phosphatidylserine decarboxylase